jgi:hypothetical protein
MSFGYSVSDFIAVGTLAWSVYKSCKEAPNSFNNIHNEVQSLQIVLRAFGDTLEGKSLPPDQMKDVGLF